MGRFPLGMGDSVRESGGVIMEFMVGYSDSDIINYCPNCGERITGWVVDGMGRCDSCKLVFGVIECDESEREVE